MGTLELKGSTLKKTVSTAAIPTSGGPSLVGKFVNKTGQAMKDLTIEVRRTDDSDSPPAGGESKVSLPNTNGGSSAASNTSTGGTKTVANIDFTNQQGVGELPDSAHVEFEVSLTSVDGDDVELHITPSVVVGTAHADLLAQAHLSHDADSLTSTLEAPYHANVSMRIRNVDRNGNSMTALSGELLTSEGGLGLSSVDIHYVHAPVTPESTSIQINGEQFTITGFDKLVPGTSYDLLVGFTDPPQEAYSLKVTGTF